MYNSIIEEARERAAEIQTEDIKNIEAGRFDLIDPRRMGDVSLLRSLADCLCEAIGQPVEQH